MIDPKEENILGRHGISIINLLRSRPERHIIKKATGYYFMSSYIESFL